jgi:hypothetical protein
MKKLIIFIIVFLVSCQEDPIEKHENYTIINEHKGGIVHEVIRFIKDLPKPIKIKGSCASSCTLVFEYPNTCVYEKSKILFHAPINTSKKISEVWFNEMQKKYPEKIKKWFPATLDGKDYIFTGLEMNKKFDIPLCD